MRTHAQITTMGSKPTQRKTCLKRLNRPRINMNLALTSSSDKAIQREKLNEDENNILMHLTKNYSEEFSMIGNNLFIQRTR